MSFTYDPTDDIGTVRRLTGETVAVESETTDEDIQAWLDDNSGNVEIAAVKILRSLAAKWAKRSTIQTGNEKLQLSDVSKQYQAMADSLESSLGQDTTLSNVGVNRVRDSHKAN